MPEYLSPGVFIEEIPARLKAIEGVSTSTAGFVGAAERGTVPGYPVPPLTLPAGVTFSFPVDRGPVLVTSFAEFSRAFGGPLELRPGETHGYLARAVRGFFANGGKRAYITRVVHFDAANLAVSATRSQLQVFRGTVLRLARRARATDTTVFLRSLRHVDRGGASNSIDFFRRTDLTTAVATGTVADYDTQAGSVTLAAAVGADLDPNDVIAVPAGSGWSPATASGPVLFARTPGGWSEHLAVTITSADGPPVPVAQAGASGDTAILVRAASSFYLGAFIEIDHAHDNPTAGDRIRTYHEVTAISGNLLTIAPALASSVTTDGFARVMEIDITIEDPSGPTPLTETFKRLGWNQSADPLVRRRHYATVINSRSRLVYVLPPWADTALGGTETGIDDQPVTIDGFAQGPAAANVGADNFVQIGSDDYEGVDNGPGRRTGIESLADSEEIRIIACPGQSDQAVQNALIAQAERMRYRFAVLDGEAEPDPNNVITAILAHRNTYDSSFAAYYTPWLADTEAGNTIYLPPSGHVAGVYARVDNDRGVWKAPANEVVRAVTGLFATITTGEQDVLNPRGVNAIRLFEGRGIRIWGGRTLSSDPEFRYINVRRFLIFLEASLDRGTQWVVFEPNAPETWSRVTDSVSAFLHTQWRTGALFGRKPEDAFFVRCDETTMTADDVQNGRLICEIGVAIVRPAEFVIFRIEQITGFAKQG
ncbi:MAG: phage tail sheath subtilisin-like domain-containing protein [Gemmatimonadaceae bacterium]